jgi:D-arabinose 1-dehydrogenase-like Zn-dependent alcohol dehydrogenase
MGHEVVGKVVELGPDAKGVDVGDEFIVGCPSKARLRWRKSWRWAGYK